MDSNSLFDELQDKLFDQLQDKTIKLIVELTELRARIETLEKHLKSELYQEALDELKRIKKLL